MKSGTERLAPARKRRETLRTCPGPRLSGPTMKPGVSQSESTGSPKASQSCRKRAAFSAPVSSIAPPRCIGSFAISPKARPSMRTSAVIMPMPEAAPQLEHRDSSQSVSITRADVVDAAPVLGDQVAQDPLVRAVPVGERSLEVAEILFATSIASTSSSTSTSITPRPSEHGGGTDVLGRIDAEAAALDHRRTAHPEARVLRGDDHVASSRRRRRCRRSRSPRRC